MAKKLNGLSLELLSHPGETLLELMQDRGMDQKELAIRTGFSAKHISKVISGENDITVRFAYALENVFGVTAIFWTNLQANYDLEKMMILSAESVTDGEIDILSEFKDIIPYFVEKEFMAKTRDKTQTVLSLRRILRVNQLTAIPDLAVRSSFRISNPKTINPYVLFSWIRICEMTADYSAGKELNSEGLRESLTSIRQVMFENKWCEIESKLKALFKENGIQFRVVRHFRGAPVQGFIEKLDNNEILLCLTLRYTYAGIFWFTLFHEIAHIINGDIRKRYIDYDDIDNEEEFLADEFAKKALIDPNEWIFFTNSNNFSLGSIKTFSKNNSVLPCIVIERLQKEGYIPYSMYVKEKVQYQ